MTEKQIRARMGEHYLALATLKKRLDEAQRRKRLTCGFCKKQHAVTRLTLIQTYWYTEPYSCTGGDYWSRGEMQYQCPSCGSTMRDPTYYKREGEPLHTGAQWDPRINELAPYFGAKEDKHTR